MHPWDNPENVEKLKAMWLAGNSTTQIAAAIGLDTTRSSIAGKIGRLGLAREPLTPEILNERRSKRRQEFILSNGTGPKTPPVKLVEDISIHPEPLKLNGEFITLEMLNRKTQCYYPHDPVTGREFIFCGHPIEKKGYCRAHYSLCFQKPKSQSAA